MAAQLALGALAIGDLVQEGVERPAVVLLDRGDRQLDRKRVAVAVQSLELDAPVEHGSLAGREKPLQAPAVASRIDGGTIVSATGAADRLIGAPAEYRLGLGVPADDPALGVHRDVALVRGRDHLQQALAAAARGRDRVAHAAGEHRRDERQHGEEGDPPRPVEPAEGDVVDRDPGDQHREREQDPTAPADEAELDREQRDGEHGEQQHRARRVVARRQAKREGREQSTPPRPRRGSPRPGLFAFLLETSGTPSAPSGP